MKKILISALSLCALLSSCANDEVVTSQPTTAPAEVATKALGVTVGIDTKAIRTGAAFLSGEKIGLFISGVAVPAEGAPADYTAVKKIYTCPPLAGNWTTDATDAIMLNNKEANVYAFHPSELVPDMTAFTVPVDVKAVQLINGTETNQVDYLWAKSTPVSNAVGKDKAVLAFKHALCQLAFIINKHATYVGGEGKASTMQVAGKLPASTKLMAGANGKLSLEDGKFTSLAAVNALEFKPETSADYFVANATAASALVVLKALVAPQANLVYAGDDMLYIKLTVDGKPMEVALPVGDVSAWDAGKTYTYTLTLKGTDIVVASTNVTIADWTAGGSAAADLN